MGAETKPSPAAMVRTCRLEDADGITMILAQSGEAASWSAESLRESLICVGAVALVSQSQGTVTGFIIGRQIGEEAEILNLAITPARRRKGEGAALLREEVDEFAKRGVSRVFLEVRESNATAISFYTKHGFTKTGRRTGYYRDPDEAAILMEKNSQTRTEIL